MPVDDIKYGEFKGKTQADIEALSDRVGKIDARLDGIDKSLQKLHSKNGWRGAFRPGMIGTGGAGLAYAIIEAMRVAFR